jgi:hypothetical protein
MLNYHVLTLYGNLKCFYWRKKTIVFAEISILNKIQIKYPLLEVENLFNAKTTSGKLHNVFFLNMRNLWFWITVNGWVLIPSIYLICCCHKIHVATPYTTHFLTQSKTLSFKSTIKYIYWEYNAPVNHVPCNTKIKIWISF